MSGGADLFVVCKKCGSEVSPYITECPYCGKRLRKRAPRIDREGGDARPRAVSPPSLGPLRAGEIPGIKADSTRRPIATCLLIALSLIGYLALRAGYTNDLVLTSLSDEPWRIVASSFCYANLWYALAVLLGIGIFGWRLELRHGPIVVIALFVICGIGGNAVAAQVETTPFLLGAPGAGIGMIAAWAVPDLLRARRNVDYDGDLLGAFVIALVIALMPIAVLEASAVATATGLVAGLVIGYALSYTAAAR
jgi:membrane associated rhomboid family serine protease